MSDLNDFLIRNGVLKKYTGESADVVIPEGVTSIGDSAFEECKRIVNVLVPDSVQSIGSSAFKKCLNMETINLPNSLEFVGAEAFWDCHSLEKLCFPSQTIFQGKVIGACWNLKTVMLPETIEFFVPVESNKIECIVAPKVKIDNILETSNRHINKRFAAAVGYIKYTDRFTEKDIADSYNSYLFKHKKELLPVVWANDSVQILAILEESGRITKKNIDNEYVEPAMKANATGCISFLMDWKHQNIKESGITDVLSKIEKDPYSVTEMKKLWGYTKLNDGTIMITHYKGVDSEITVPPRIGEATVSRIGSYAFSPYMESEQGVCKKRSPKRVDAMKEIKSVIISEGIIAIDERAFYWGLIAGSPLNRCSALKSILIPSTVTSIGNEAFSGCNSLTDVTIPNSVTSIGNSAFKYCYSLSNVVILDSVTSIGFWAFAYCHSLKYVTISDSVISIRNEAFFETPWLMSQPRGFICAGRVVIGYTGIEADIVIPEGIISIGDYAFYDNDGLTNVTIPDCVKSIGMYAFGNCSNLVEVIIPNSVEQMDLGVFLNSKNTVIKTNKGSYAEQYAKENGIPVEYIEA